MNSLQKHNKYNNNNSNNNNNNDKKIIVIIVVFLERLLMRNMLNCAEQVQKKCKTNAYKTLERA